MIVSRSFHLRGHAFPFRGRAAHRETMPSGTLSPRSMPSCIFFVSFALFVGCEALRASDATLQDTAHSPSDQDPKRPRGTFIDANNESVPFILDTKPAHRSPSGGGRRDDDFDDFDDSSFPRRPFLDDSSQLMDDALEQIRGWTMTAASLLPVAFADNTLWLAHSFDSWTTWMRKVHATIQAMIGAAHAAEPAYHQVTLQTSDDRLLRLSFESSQTIV